mgnify:CR=1 FL=1
MPNTRFAFSRKIAQIARPIQTCRLRPIQCAQVVCPRQHVVIVDRWLTRIGLMIRYAIFIGKVIDDGRIGPHWTLLEQIGFVFGEQSPEAIVPRAFANTIASVDLVAIFIRNGTEKCAPGFGARPRHAAFGNGGANLVGSAKSRASAGFPKAKIAPESILTAGQIPQCIQTGHEKAELLHRPARTAGAAAATAIAAAAAAAHIAARTAGAARRVTARTAARRRAAP